MECTRVLERQPASPVTVRIVSRPDPDRAELDQVAGERRLGDVQPLRGHNAVQGGRQKQNGEHDDRLERQKDWTPAGAVGAVLRAVRLRAV